MKRIFTLSAMCLLFVALSFTSCSTEKSIASAFVKNGYQMVTLTAQQQYEVAPLLAEFPSFNQTALGYLALGNSITFIYAASDAEWNAYGARLMQSGFSDLGSGYARADKASGVTYNVSCSPTTVYGQKLLLVTYLSATF